MTLRYFKKIDTHGVSVSVSVSERSASRLANASVSGSLSRLSDAYQGRDFTDTYLPGALGFPFQNRVEFQKRELL